MLIFKKEKQVRKLVLEHMSEVQACLMESRSTIEAYIAGDIEEAGGRASQVIAIESRADVLERQIRESLLKGAFLPHIRSDIYRLVESVDSIAGKAEDIARFVIDQSPVIPDEFQEDMMGIFRLSLDCFQELRKAYKDFFKPKGKLTEVNEHVNRVCEIETEVDLKESTLAREMFASSIGLVEKIHLEQLIRQIGNIADLSEDAADELEFAAMKSVV